MQGLFGNLVKGGADAAELGTQCVHLCAVMDRELRAKDQCGRLQQELERRDTQVRIVCEQAQMRQNEMVKRNNMLLKEIVRLADEVTQRNLRIENLRVKKGQGPISAVLDASHGVHTGRPLPPAVTLDMKQLEPLSGTSDADIENMFAQLSQTIAASENPTQAGRGGQLIDGVPGGGAMVRAQGGDVAAAREKELRDVLASKFAEKLIKSELLHEREKEKLLEEVQDLKTKHGTLREELDCLRGELSEKRDNRRKSPRGKQSLIPNKQTSRKSSLRRQSVAGADVEVVRGRILMVQRNAQQEAIMMECHDSLSAMANGFLGIKKERDNSRKRVVLLQVQLGKLQEDVAAKSRKIQSLHSDMVRSRFALASWKGSTASLATDGANAVQRDNTALSIGLPSAAPSFATKPSDTRAPDDGYTPADEEFLQDDMQTPVVEALRTQHAAELFELKQTITDLTTTDHLTKTLDSPDVVREHTEADRRIAALREKMEEEVSRTQKLMSLQLSFFSQRHARATARISELHKSCEKMKIRTAAAEKRTITLQANVQRLVAENTELSSSLEGLRSQSNDTAVPFGVPPIHYGTEKLKRLAADLEAAYSRTAALEGELQQERASVQEAGEKARILASELREAKGARASPAASPPAPRRTPSASPRGTPCGSYSNMASLALDLTSPPASQHLLAGSAASLHPQAHPVVDHPPVVVPAPAAGKGSTLLSVVRKTVRKSIVDMSATCANAVSAVGHPPEPQAVSMPVLKPRSPQAGLEVRPAGVQRGFSGRLSRAASGASLNVVLPGPTPHSGSQTDAPPDPSSVVRSPSPRVPTASAASQTDAMSVMGLTDDAAQPSAPLSPPRGVGRPQSPAPPPSALLLCTAEGGPPAPAAASPPRKASASKPPKAQATPQRGDAAAECAQTQKVAPAPAPPANPPCREEAVPPSGQPQGGAPAAPDGGGGGPATTTAAAGPAEGPPPPLSLPGVGVEEGGRERERERALLQRLRELPDRYVLHLACLHCARVMHHDLESGVTKRSFRAKPGQTPPPPPPPPPTEKAGVGGGGVGSGMWHLSPSPAGGGAVEATGGGGVAKPGGHFPAPPPEAGVASESEMLAMVLRHRSPSPGGGGGGGGGGVCARVGVSLEGAAAQHAPRSTAFPVRGVRGASPEWGSCRRVADGVIPTSRCVSRGEFVTRVGVAHNPYAAANEGREATLQILASLGVAPSSALTSQPGPEGVNDDFTIKLHQQTLPFRVDDA